MLNADSPVRRYLSFLIPRYDEIVLFAMSATCLLLIGDKLLEIDWQTIHFREPHTDDIRLFIVLLVFLSGLFLSLMNAFRNRQKGPLEKYFMLFFAVGGNAASGAFSAIYVLQFTQGWKVVFPFINFVSSIMLFVLLRYDVIDIDSIDDNDAPLLEVLLTALFVLSLYILCSRYYHLYWAMTLSICVSYATNFHRNVLNILIR